MKRRFSRSGARNDLGVPPLWTVQIFARVGLFEAA